MIYMAVSCHRHDISGNVRALLKLMHPDIFPPDSLPLSLTIIDICGVCL